MLITSLFRFCLPANRTRGKIRLHFRASRGGADVMDRSEDRVAKNYLLSAFPRAVCSGKCAEHRESMCSWVNRSAVTVDEGKAPLSPRIETTDRRLG
jgi:hypothetical protein